jgi:WXG100 family type VII secretion target
MARYLVQTEELDAVIARMQAYEQHLLEAIQNADKRVSAMHATWSGRAAEAHQAAHARWRADATAMHAALSRMRAIAATAHGNYTATIATNTGMWGGV